MPDGELVAVSMRKSPEEGDEDEHRAWSRIGLPDPSLMDESGRPSTTHLPARPGDFGEGFFFVCFWGFLTA